MSGNKELLIMKLSDYLAVTRKDEAIRIAALQGACKIRLLGSTLPTSAIPQISGWGNDSLVIYPEGKDGIIAIVVQVLFKGKNGWNDSNDFTAFLRVIPQKDGSVYLNLEDQWFPAKRVGQLTVHGMDVRIGNKTFSTRSGCAPEAIAFPDGNLLCKYLFGEASAGEVITAATESKLEENARKQLPKLVARINELENENLKLERDKQWFLQTNQALEKIGQGLIGEMTALKKEAEKMSLMAGASTLLYEQLKQIPELFLPKFAKTFMGDYRSYTAPAESK